MTRVRAIRARCLKGAMSLSSSRNLGGDEVWRRAWDGFWIFFCDMYPASLLSPLKYSSYRKVNILAVVCARLSRRTLAHSGSKVHPVHVQCPVHPSWTPPHEYKRTPREAPTACYTIYLIFKHGYMAPWHASIANTKLHHAVEIWNRNRSLYN